MGSYEFLRASVWSGTTMRRLLTPAFSFRLSPVSATAPPAPRRPGANRRPQLGHVHPVGVASPKSVTLYDILAGSRGPIRMPIRQTLLLTAAAALALASPAARAQAAATQPSVPTVPLSVPPSEDAPTYSPTLTFDVASIREAPRVAGFAMNIDDHTSNSSHLGISYAFFC